MNNSEKYGNMDRQEELLSRYCAVAEKELLKARDKNEARDITIRLCKQFESECDSSIVITGTKAYIEALVSRLPLPDLEERKI